ncbi:hypothetical protein Tco_0726428 [Tanacetum coccineum]|uniref:Uncharacterized protein n=1 Tax=Tanacetum coccineum TaxID=301880 RepID=A0ABQ4YGG1_9ASTR
MFVLESCPKHNMVAYLDKTEGNAEFHEVINFLARSSIHHALTVSLVVSTTFVEQFWMSAKSKMINNVRYITAKVAGKPISISEASIRSDLLFDDVDGIDSLPNQAIFDAIKLMSYEGDLNIKAYVEPPSDPSPRPSPTPHISDFIPESSDGNQGGHSSSDKSLSGNEGDMTLQSAQIKKLKKQAKPVITHHRAWMKSVSLKQRLAGKRSLKKTWVQKESVSKQGRKSAKDEPSVHKDSLFDELPEDTVDYIETEVAQDMGRSSDKVNEEMENDDAEVSTEDVLSTAQENISTDTPKVSTDKEKVSTDTPKVSTDGLVSTDKEKDSTERTDEGINDQTEGRRATQTIQTTQRPTSTMFGDDETIAQVLLNIRSFKRKGERKENESETKSEGIPEAKKKFKQLVSDEEMARKLQEDWETEEEGKRLAEEEATNDTLIRNYDDIKARIEADRLLAKRLQEQEREQFTVEERAKFLHDTIAAQRRFLSQQ